MPQYRILISAIVDGEYAAASWAANQFAQGVKTSNTGVMVRDSRVLKVEDVSPPLLDAPDSDLSHRPGIATGTGP